MHKHNNTALVQSALARHQTMWTRLLDDASLIDQITCCSKAVSDAVNSGQTVFFAGNGGSFADAQHITAEFVGRYKCDRRPLRAVCLGANLSTLTAVANDYAYEEVFARELRAFAQLGDVLIALSTSGNSANIVQLLESAQALGVTVFVLSGGSGGMLAKRVNTLCVPSAETARIQEAHIAIGHIICEYVDAHLDHTQDH